MGIIEDKIEAKLAALGAVFTDEGQRTRLALADALAETVRGNRIDGARPVPLSGAARSRTIKMAPGRLFGWSVLASAGPVRLTFYDGSSTAADPVAVLDLADQEHDNMWLGVSGVAFGEALYLDVTGTGTGLIGAVFLGAVD